MSLNGKRPACVAVDAMGGDNAPREVVKGAIEAHRRYGIDVVLVGDESRVREELTALGADVPVVNAPEVIGMEEAVTPGLLRRRSSLRVATELVTEHNADAVVSCGNSAAILVVGMTQWGTQPGVDRPAFGGSLPTRTGDTFILDIGANASVKAANLVQFAVMGDVFVRLSKGIQAPRVALLSNGSESTKGTKVVKEAHEALEKLDLNFVGNIEGNQVFAGLADVVVCDGFTGNVLLKSSEGVAMEIFRLVRSEVNQDVMVKLGALLMRPALQRVRRRVDYEEVGGVPVLGVNGVMINCHGRSHAKAVTNAIRTAQRLAREHMVERIGAALHEESLENVRSRRWTRALHLRHREA